jgi:hypothetical protein
MKKAYHFIWIALIALASCKEDDISLFDKPPEERVKEAIAALRADLIAPENGWRVKYQPERDSGYYYVLLKFKDQADQLIIEGDLPYNDGEFFRDTITYRIDSSLGLELIFENYSMFSFLFEQNDATFQAEYEFNYISKTPNGELVFKSKTDPTEVSTIVFEKAAANDINLLGRTLATNLLTLRGDIDNFVSAQKITFVNKDLVLYARLDDFTRTINISAASKKTNVASSATVSYFSPYVLKGDSIVFEEPFSATLLGYNIKFKAIKLNAITDGTINICADPIDIHSFTGRTSNFDDIILETSYDNLTGKQFVIESDFYFMPLVYIFKDGASAKTVIEQDIEGAAEFDMIYDPSSSDYRIGFYLFNANGTATFAYHEFAPVLSGNILQFNLKPDLKFSQGIVPDADPAQIDNYINSITQGDIYVLQISPGVYEFKNPCTGWSFIGINGN